jgi:hypothetical protein
MTALDHRVTTVLASSSNVNLASISIRMVLSLCVGNDTGELRLYHLDASKSKARRVSTVSSELNLVAAQSFTVI